MMYTLFISPLILATFVSADYYIDNANTSVVYSMAPSQSGQAWQTFSVNTQSLTLSFSNSTGNYSIPLDASHCYDQNYALGVCGMGDNCFVQIPFTGSGITMYVFNAGFSGMTASFAIDDGTPIFNSMDEPPPPNYQVSNASLYNIQGLTSGNHTIVMTILDWNGSPTSMKFDYAYVNESLVAAPVTTSASSTSTGTASFSQTPTQTSTGNSLTSNKVNVGVVIGGALAGVIVLAGVLISIFCCCKRNARRQPVLPVESAYQVNPFVSQHLDNSNSTPPGVPHTPFTHLEANPPVPPHMRSAILREALAARTYSSPNDEAQYSQSIRSGMSFQNGCQPSSGVERPSSIIATIGSPFSDPQAGRRYDLTAEQSEVIERLRADNVAPETIARVIEGLMISRLSADEAGSRKMTSDRSITSVVPPPSYQTWER